MNSRFAPASGQYANLHANLVAVRIGREDGWTGILIIGDSGSGKTSLSLGIIEHFRRIGSDAMLVSDDRTDVYILDGKLVGAPPAAIAGKVEIHGLGISETAYLEQAPVELVVNLMAAGEIERMPEPQTRMVLGVEVPAIGVPQKHETQGVRIVTGFLTGRHD